jgi:hypothetical protein
MTIGRGTAFFAISMIAAFLIGPFSYISPQQAQAESPGTIEVEPPIYRNEYNMAIEAGNRDSHIVISWDRLVRSGVKVPNFAYPQNVAAFTGYRIEYMYQAPGRIDDTTMADKAVAEQVCRGTGWTTAQHGFNGGPVSGNDIYDSFGRISWSILSGFHPTQGSIRQPAYFRILVTQVDPVIPGYRVPPPFPLACTTRALGPKTDTDTTVQVDVMAIDKATKNAVAATVKINGKKPSEYPAGSPLRSKEGRDTAPLTFTLPKENRTHYTISLSHPDYKDSPTKEIAAGLSHRIVAQLALKTSTDDSTIGDDTNPGGGGVAPPPDKKREIDGRDCFSFLFPDINQLGRPAEWFQPVQFLVCECMTAVDLILGWLGESLFPYVPV